MPSWDEIDIDGIAHGHRNRPVAPSRSTSSCTAASDQALADAAEEREQNEVDLAR